jgi:hypothetical protein
VYLFRERSLREASGPSGRRSDYGCLWLVRIACYGFAFALRLQPKSPGWSEIAAGLFFFGEARGTA